MRNQTRQLLNQIEEDATYAQAIAELRRGVSEMIQRLDEDAVNLAALGIWRHWNDTIPDGTELRYDHDELRHCTDSNVRKCMEAIEALDRLLNSLHDQAPEHRDGRPDRKDPFDD